MQRRQWLKLCAGAPLGSLVGCGDDGAASIEVAKIALEAGLPVITRDTEQVRLGLPLGAKLLGEKLPADITAKKEIQEAIRVTRDKTDQLRVAKSTFFSFADVDGLVLRSEIDPDRFVDQNALKAFPDLAKALTPKAGVVETYGELDALRGVKRGADLAWVLAHAVLGANGEPRGLFLSGWSMRLYARVLQEAARGVLTARGKDKPNVPVPLVYTYLLKKGGAYGDPDAPDVLAEALLTLGDGDLALAKEIDRRLFGIASRPAPELGDDARIVAVASVI